MAYIKMGLAQAIIVLLLASRCIAHFHFETPTFKKYTLADHLLNHAFRIVWDITPIAVLLVSLLIVGQMWIYLAIQKWHESSLIKVVGYSYKLINSAAS